LSNAPNPSSLALRLLLGFAAATGAFGGVGIDLVLRQSYQGTGSETAAFWVFLALYCVAALVTWWMYVRRPFAVWPVTAAAIGRSASLSAPGDAGGLAQPAVAGRIDP
jgi:NNP family nitrate/nitrite transporter-like MFS transporter